MTTGTHPPSTKLPQSLKDSLKQLGQRLNGARAGAFHRALAFDYAIIAATMAAMIVMSWQPLFWILLPVAWLIIASRQHGILVLLHDATHGLAHRNRTWNELIGELACGAPCSSP